ncbi:exocyst complex component EXO70B1 [Tanacetum coccineum]
MEGCRNDVPNRGVDCKNFGNSQGPAGPMTAFAGGGSGVIQQGIMIHAAADGASGSQARRKDLVTRFDVKPICLRSDQMQPRTSTVVSDEQLQSELRVSISAIVIPTYRSFIRRFSQVFTPGRKAEKYIKYQPEDIETCIEELFDGTTSQQSKKR